MVAQIRAWALLAQRIFEDSAAETGGMRRLRFVQDVSCNIIVRKVNFDQNTDDDTFGALQIELARQGYNRPDRKYMLFSDAAGNGICGIANVKNDDQPGPANANNTGPRYGRTDAGCWGARVPAHELMHNLGGVQRSAPHTSNGWHCIDEYDRMCYSTRPISRRCRSSARTRRTIGCSTATTMTTSAPTRRTAATSPRNGTPPTMPSS